MRITFKDVGQGDSILLEWNHNGVEKIGIIDCNKNQARNPIVDYLQTKSYREVQFIILSHPHVDHYSGMLDLLRFLNKNDIEILMFGHTIGLVGESYFKKVLKYSEIDSRDSNQLNDLITFIDTLKKSKKIKSIRFINESVRFDLSEAAYLKCLSPGAAEIEEYMKIVDLNPDRNKKAASRAANYLSTLFKLVVGPNYYLFTSDTEAFSFDRIVQEDQHPYLQSKRMHFGQLPHHGSKKNYHAPFWNYIQKSDMPTAVISAGLNKRYGHPDLEVIKAFYDLGYEIKCTNIVNGMKEHVDFLSRLKASSAKLDSFSNLVNSPSSGDITLVITA